MPRRTDSKKTLISTLGYQAGGVTGKKEGPYHGSESCQCLPDVRTIGRTKDDVCCAIEGWMYIASQRSAAVTNVYLRYCPQV